MKITQVRNATIIVEYNNTKFLIDPWLMPKDYMPGFDTAINSEIRQPRAELPFEIEKITNAIFKAAQAIGGSNYEEAEDLANKVCDYIENVEKIPAPTVEHVQDTVEKMMIENGHARNCYRAIAKALLRPLGHIAPHMSGQGFYRIATFRDIGRV